MVFLAAVLSPVGSILAFSPALDQNSVAGLPTTQLTALALMLVLPGLTALAWREQCLHRVRKRRSRHSLRNPASAADSTRPARADATPGLHARPTEPVEPPQRTPSAVAQPSPARRAA